MLDEMKRKIDWLTSSMQGMATWLTTKTNEILDGAEVKKLRKKKARQCTREVLALMEDRLEDPMCARKGNTKI